MLGPRTTLIEMLLKRKLDLPRLRFSGSRCWYKILGKQIDKFNPKTREGILIGYTRETHGYKLRDIQEDKVVVSRELKLNESTTTEDLTVEPEDDRSPDYVAERLCTVGSSSQSTEDGKAQVCHGDVVVDADGDKILDSNA